MRNVVVLCLLLLFAGGQGLFASKAANAGPSLVGIPTIQSLSAKMKPIDDAGMARLERCCSQGDTAQSTTDAAPCLYDCTMTTADFALAIGFNAHKSRGRADKNHNTAFGNALFRPPIV